MSNSPNTPFQPFALATGIGSMPFGKPSDAVDLVSSCFPDMPHWPQLPRRSEKEHFIYQFLQPLVACRLLIHQDDTWCFDTTRPDFAECMTDFYTICLQAEEGDAKSLDAFQLSPGAAAGFDEFHSRAEIGSLEKAAFVKGQIAGPLSIALEIKDQQGKAAYYDESLRDVIVRTLALSARRQAVALSEFGNKPIVLIDDPGLCVYGTHLHLGISREMIIEDMNAICSAIESGNALTGVHACEAMDWSLVLDSRARILSLDAYRFGPSLLPYTKPLRSFIEEGGVVAWGIVPTLDDPFAESVESLADRLVKLWDELFPADMDRGLIVQQSMITPACGVGLLPPDHARRIYNLTADLSLHLRKNLRLL